MKKRIKKLSLSIALLLIVLTALIVNKEVNIDRYKGKVNVTKVDVIPKGSKKETEVIKEKDKEKEIEKETISSFSVLRYKINYKLDANENVNRDVLINVKITDEDKKYVVLKEINEENISSTKTNDGLEILVKNVRTNIEHSLEIEVQINNAPNGYKFAPVVEVKEKTSEGIERRTKEVEVTTNSLEGILIDDNGNIGVNKEVRICKKENEICTNEKITYTDENGKYVFAGLSEGIYKITLEEGYKVKEDTEITVEKGNNELNIVYDQKGRFSASIKKYLKEVTVGEKKYEIEETQKVVVPIKTKEYVKALYVFKIENISESDGYIKIVRETLPEGFKLTDSKINKDWEKDGDYLINKEVSKELLRVNEEKELEIEIESKEKVNAKEYKNKVEILGESYHTVKYVINNEVYKEFEVEDREKIDNYKVERENYEFSGWYTSKEYKNKFNFNTEITRDTILYGKLVSDAEVTVTYMKDENTVFDTRVIRKGEKAENITGPGKIGYTFKNWKKGNEAYNFDLEVNEDLTLYADYDKEVYTVNFYVPGEYGVYKKVASLEQEIEYEETVTEPSEIEIRYYDFKGWYTEETLENKAEFPYEITEDTNFYGRYDLRKYNILFLGEDKVTELSRQDNLGANELIVEPEAPEKEGFTFTGWKDAQTDASYTVPEDRLPVSDVRVYAVYERNKYNLRVDNKNGTAIENYELLFEEEKEINSPSKEMHKFTGWTLTSTSNKSTIENNIFKMGSADTLLEANYQIKTLTVEYYNTDNSLIDEVEYDFNEVVTAPEVEIEDHYHFKRWKNESNETVTLGDIAYSLFGDTDRVKLYLETEGDTYTVEYVDYNNTKLDEEEVRYPNSVTKKDEVEAQLQEEDHYVGHTFEKWQVNNNDVDFDNLINLCTTNNCKITLKAKYLTNMLGVIFRDIITTTPVDVEYGNKVNTSDIPNNDGKTGYTFAGWKEENANDYFDFENEMITQTRYLDAVYEANKYKIVFNVEGSESFEENFDYDEEKALTKNPYTRVGYNFIGWATEVNGEKVYNDEAVVKNLSSEDNAVINLYAVYNAKEYTVRFNANEGSGTISNEHFNYDEEKALSKNAFTRRGYTFKGWSTSTTGEKEYDDEEVVSNLTTEDNAVIDLYAVWQTNSYTLTIDTDGGTISINNSQVLSYNEEKEVPNPSKDGYTFDHWNVSKTQESDSGEAGTLSGKTFTMKDADTTLKAIYREKSYKVMYNANTGLGEMEDEIFSYDVDTSRKLKENTFTKTGYKFAGWSKEVNGEVVYTSETSLKTIANELEESSLEEITIYAKWTPISYTVRFAKSDEQVQGEMEDQSFNYDEEKALRKNTFAKEGYTFAGWTYNEGTLSDEQEVSNLTTEDNSVVTLTSKFEIEKYKVIFVNEGLEYEVQNNVEYNSLITAPSTNPSKAHYKFKGWKLNGESSLFDFENTNVSNNIANNNKEITLVSVYGKIESPEITLNPVEWTNDKVGITLSNTKGYSMKVKVGENSYEEYSEEVFTEENTEVRGKSIDGEDESEETIATVDNIDKEAPSVGEITKTPSVNQVEVTTTLSDSQSGIRNVKLRLLINPEVTYCEETKANEELSEENGRKTGSHSYSYSCMVDNLQEKTIYDGILVVEDVAGNITEESIQIETSEMDVIARIIEYSGNELEEDEYIRFPSLTDAINHEYCQSGHCTIQMVKDTRESVTISSTQDIKLDLNGKTVTGTSRATITNNGKLQVVDDNTPVEDETDITPVGTIINNHVSDSINDGIGILNNGLLVFGDNEVADDEPGAIVSQMKPAIVSNNIGISTPVTPNTDQGFKFYDGTVSGTVGAINGKVTAQPYLHNVNITGTSPVIANLQILADAVARVKRTGIYYTQLDGAKTDTYKGKYIEEEVGPETNLINLIELSKDNQYTFVEDISGDVILKDLSGNNHNVEVGAKITKDNSLKFDETDDYAIIENGITDEALAEETVELEFSTTTTRNQIYYNGNNKQKIGIGTWDGYVIVSNQSANSYTYDMPSNLADGNKHKITVIYKDNEYKAYFDNEEMTKRSNQNSWGNDSNLYIGRRSSGDYYNGNIYSLKVYDKALTEEEITNGTNDGLILKYDLSDENGYEIDETKVIRNNNQGVHNTTATSSIKIDLTDYEYDQILTINASIGSETKYDFGYATIKEASDTYNKNYIPTYNDTNGRFIYISGIQKRKDYSISLEKGKSYYLYLGYYKNGCCTNSYGDTFKIYSINLLSKIPDTNTNELMPNMDEIVDYFDYSSYENNEWKNKIGTNNMTSYGTVEYEDNAIKLDNINKGAYMTLPIDNNGDSIIYMVVKNNEVKSTNAASRLYDIYYSTSPSYNTPTIYTRNNNLNLSAYNRDVNLSIDARNYNVIVMTIDSTTKKLKAYINGKYINEVTYNNYGQLLYLAKSSDGSTGADANNSYKMIAIGNELQSEEEIVENSNFLYYKYILESKLTNSNLAYTEKVPKLNTELEGSEYKEADTIELLKNITLQSSFEVEETRDVVLDLRGHTLTTADEDYVIKNSGNLKLIDTKYYDDIDKAQQEYEEENARYLAEYNAEMEEYNALVDSTNSSYREEYENNLESAITKENERKQAQNDYEEALEKYNQDMEQYEIDLAKYKKQLAKYTMPNMDGIVDYFDYNNFEDGVWNNTLSNSHDITIYGTPELEDNAVKFDNLTNSNYATLPIDNSGYSIIYMVTKFNTSANYYNRLYEIPYSLTSFPNQTPIIYQNGSGVYVSSYENDYEVSNVSAQDLIVTAMILDKTNSKIELYVNGVKTNEFSFSGNYGDILYLAKCNNDESESNGNNSYKMIAIGNKLQSEEEIIENSNYLYDKYIEGLPLDNSSPLVTNFRYTGSVQEFVAPVTGTYKLETWGAQGGGTSSTPGGKGAYASGTIELNKDETIYVYVGGAGKDDSSVTFNNGGITNTEKPGYSGGGATDIRLVAGEWDDFDSLKSRIMVAAGGGGSVTWFLEQSGGAGGALTGLDGTIYGSSGTIAKGGTQTEGGQDGQGLGNPTQGGFGKVSDGFSLLSDSPGFAGSGYYAGGHGANGDFTLGSGAGGSSFVSGYNGCDAIDESSTEDNIIHTGQSIHYSGKKFKTPEMLAGNENMPARNGIDTITGNSGNGFAKITILDYEGELPSETEALVKPTKPVKPTLVTNGYSVEDYVSDGLLLSIDAMYNSGSSNIIDYSGNNVSSNNYNVIVENNAFIFNGSNTYINFGKATDLGLSDNHSVTFDYLMSYSDYQYARTIMGAWESGGVNVGIDDAQPNLIKQTTNDYDYNRINSTKTLNDGLKHHITNVFDFETNKMKLYIDGKLDTSRTFNNQMNLSDYNFIIGSLNGSSQFYDGKLYNVRIYNKALTEEEITQNYKVDSYRYGINLYPSSNTSDGIISSKSESNEVYRLFDENKETTYSSDLTEETILWNMEEENTIKSLKIYGSSDSSKYPSSISFFGSKDGEEYEEIITEKELEAKGLNEYNEITIPEEGKEIDSYKYYKWILKNDNGIELNEIEIEKYDVVREKYLTTYSVNLNKSNWTYKSKNSTSYDSMSNNSDGSLYSTVANSDNQSVTYYNEKITVPKTGLQVEGSIGLYNNYGNNLGEVYIGLSNTKENVIDFEEYVNYDVSKYNSEDIKTFNFRVNKPGEYYIKIIMYHNTSTSGYNIMSVLHNIKFNDTPALEEATLQESTLTGSISNTTNNGIYNDEGAYLEIDDAIINIEKTGTSSSYTNGITNYGTLKLTEKAVINNKVNYATAIDNKISGDILDSPGTINIKGTGGYGIKNTSLKDDEISGINISMTSNNQYGILHYARHNLIVNNYNATGNGIGLYYNTTGNLKIDSSNINAFRGIYIEYGSGNITFTNNEFNVSESAIYLPRRDNSNIIIESGNINSNQYGIYSLYTNDDYSSSNMTINGGNITSNNITFNLTGIRNSVLNINGGNFTSKDKEVINTYEACNLKLNINGGLLKGNTHGIYISNYNNSGIYTKVNLLGGSIESGSTGIFIGGPYSSLDSLSDVTIYNKSGSTIEINSSSNNTTIKNFTNDVRSQGNGINNIGGGTINILDNVVLNSTSYGINNTNGTINIGIKDGISNKDGIKFYSSNIGINNTNGTINIGIKDGISNKDGIKFYSSNIGINNTSTLNWYDGTIIAKDNNGLSGRVNDTEDYHDLNVEDYDEDVTKEKITLWIPELNENESNAVAKIGGTKYPSLQSAIDALDDSEKTIELLKDIRTVSSNIITSDKKGIIDLNDYSIKAFRTLPLFINEGDITIKSNAKSQIIDSGNMLLKNSGKVKVENIYVYGTVSTIISNEGTGSVSIDKDTTLECESWGCYIIRNTSTKKITEDDSMPAVEVNGKLGKSRDNGVSMMMNGIISSDGDIVINENAYIKSFNAYTDTIGYSLKINGGKLIVNGGTITSNMYSDSRSTIETINLSNSSEIEINGGTISSGGSWNYNMKSINLSTSNNIGLITGGTIRGPINNVGLLNIKEDEGKTITISPQGESSAFMNSGTLNIYSGTITGGNVYNGLWVSGVGYFNCIIGNTGTMNVYGGTINDTIANIGTLTITGGTVTSSTTAINNKNVLTLGTKGDVDEENILKVSKENPIIQGTSVGISTSGTFNFYDGIIKGSTSFDKAPNEIEDGYEIITDSNETYSEIKYLDRLPVVSIGEDEYYTFEDAISSDNCMGQQCEMKVLRDVTYTTTKESIEIPSDKDIIIDLQGHKILTSGATLFTNEGTLEIKDSVGNGEIEETSNSIIENTGKVTISAKNLYTTNSSKTLVNKETGIMKITEGTTIKCLRSTCNVLENTSTKKITEENSIPAVEINGVLKTADAVCGSSGVRLALLSTNGDIVLNSTSELHAEAEYCNSTTHYAARIDGGKLIVNGGTINSYLKTDYYGTRAMAMLVQNDGEYEINGGTLTSFTGSVNAVGSNTKGVINYGILNKKLINEGLLNIYEKTGEETKIYGLTNSGTLNLYSGTITGGNIYNGLWVSGVGYFNCIVGNTGTMNVYGGTINDTIANTGTLTITGGTVTSSTTAINNKNVLTLGTKGDVDEENILKVSKENPIIQGTSVGISTSGTFNFYDGIIKGSTSFDKAPNEIEDGYEIITDSNETYSEIKYLDRLPVVSIGEDEYYTFEDAISSDNCMGQQCEMKVLRDVTYTTTKESIEIPSDKDIIIDLQGHKILTSGATLFTNEGTLEIKDSVGNGEIEETSNSIIENTGKVTISAKNLYTTNSSKTLVNKETGIMKITEGTTIKCLRSTCNVLENTSTKKITEENSIPAVEINGVLKTADAVCGSSGVRLALLSTNGDIVLNSTSELHAEAEYCNRTTHYAARIDGGKLIVNGGTINSYLKTDYYGTRAMAMLVQNDGEYEINGGTLTSFTGSVNAVGSNTKGVINYGILNKKLINEGLLNIYEKTGEETKIYGLTNSGTLNLYSGTITGGNIYNGLWVSGVGYFNCIVGNTGTMNVYGGTINDTIANTGTLTITGGTITSSDSTITNLGNATITGGTFNATNSNITITSGTANISGVIFNTGTTGVTSTGGTVNLENVTIGKKDETNNVSASDNTISTGINSTGTGIVNLKQDVNVYAKTTGISNSGGGTINLGISNINPSVTDPYIYSTEGYGINNTSGTVNYYDGKIIGYGQNKSVTGIITPLPGYKVAKDDGTDELSGYEIATLTIDATVERVVSLNGGFYPNIQTALNSAVANADNELVLYKDITLDSNLTVPDNATIIIDTNGFTLDLNGFTFVGSNIAVRYTNGTSLLAALRELLNVGNINVRKNIVIYNDDSGNKLDSAEEYTLLYNDNGVYEEIDIEEESIPGRYKVATTSSNDRIRSYNGNVTIINIPDGEYKLEGDNGSVSTFIIDNEGNLTGSIRTAYINDKYTPNNLLASSEANMIVNIQTGNNIIRYSLITIIIGLMTFILLLIKKKVRN